MCFNNGITFSHPWVDSAGDYNLKMEEIEVKFLNIDREKIEKNLVAVGATKIFDRLLKRKVFDYPDLRLDDVGAYIRLRDEEDKITLAYKRRIGMAEDGSNDEGMEEVEVNVSNFDDTAAILEKIGLTEKLNEEQRRIRYSLGSINFDIDIWPLLIPYLEIEAKSWTQVNSAIKLLGLNPKDGKIFTTMQVYELENIDELGYKKLTFKEQIKK